MVRPWTRTGRGMEMVTRQPSHVVRAIGCAALLVSCASARMEQDKPDAAAESPDAILREPVPDAAPIAAGAPIADAAAPDRVPASPDATATPDTHPVDGAPAYGNPLEGAGIPEILIKTGGWGEGPLWL